MPKCLLGVALCCVLTGCNEDEADDNSPENALSPAPITATTDVFEPVEDKTLFIVGQDIFTINDYVSDVASPAGVTAYIVADGSGVYEHLPQPHGDLDLQAYIAGYPNSVLAIGLYMVGMEERFAAREPELLASFDNILLELQSSNRPVYLRIGYEVDGPWNHYKPDDFISSWHYIVDRIRDLGITNIQTVWQIAGYCDFSGFGNTYLGLDYDAWYPGDEYVDWVGTSYFMQDRTCPEVDEAQGVTSLGGLPEGFGSLADVDEDGNSLAIDNVINYLKSKNKPIMIAESSPNHIHMENLTIKQTANPQLDDRLPATTDEIWNEWYQRFFERLEKYRGVVRAVAYINMKWDDYIWRCDPAQPVGPFNCSEGYWGDNRIQAHSDIQERWLSELNKEMYISEPVSDTWFTDSLRGWDPASLLDVESRAYSFEHKPHEIPGIVLAGRFNVGAPGVAYQDSDAVNQGAESLAANYPSGPTSRSRAICRSTEAVDTAVIGINRCALAFTTVGEFVEYTVSVKEAVEYDLLLSVASQGGGGQFHLEILGEDISGPITIPDTGAFDVFQPVQMGTVTLAAGEHTIRMVMDSNGIGDSSETIGNIDFFLLSDNSARAPFLGEALALPGIINAENYDLGGPGVGYLDLTSSTPNPYPNNDNCFRGDQVFIATEGDSDNCIVGFTRAGEQLNYSVNVEETGAYNLNLRIAHGVEGENRGKLEILLDGTPITENINIPYTGEFDIYEIITVGDINLEAGEHLLTLNFIDNGEVFTPGNIDYLEFILAGDQGENADVAERAPFLGDAVLLPGRIEANHYDLGGSDIGYVDLTLATESQGGVDGCSRDDQVFIGTEGDSDNCIIGFTEAGEQLNYSISVAETNNYSLNIRAAHGIDGADRGELEILVDGSPVTERIAIPFTGSFDTYTVISANNISLESGEHLLTINFTDNGEVFTPGNIDFLEFSLQLD